MGRSVWTGVLIVAALVAPTAAEARLDAPVPVLTLDPTSALPGDTVTISGVGHAPGNPGETCQVSVGQVLPAVQSCIFDADGGFGGSFSVPDSLFPGFYPVSVCWPACDSAQAGNPGSWQVGQDLEVVQGVSVPDVRRATEEQAVSGLRQAQLNAKPIAGDTGVVISQDPAAGDLVSSGTTVYYVLQTAGQTLFSVPEVRQVSLQDAGEKLAATCLAMVLTSGLHGTTVTSQSPAAGSQVPAGTAVTVVAALPSSPSTPRTTTPRTTPTHSSTTSPTKGRTPSSAGRSSSAGGFPSGAGSGGSPPGLGTLLVVLVILILVASTGWLAYVRPRLQARWVASHVTAIPLPTGAPVVVRTLSEPGSRDHRFSWLARRDVGRSTIEEDPT